MTDAPADQHAHAPAEHRDLVRRLLDAVEGGDVAAQLALYSDDIELEFPYSNPPRTLVGKPAIGELLSGVHTVFTFRFAIERVHAAGNVTIAEFAGANTFRADGAPYDNRYVVVLERDADGLIRRHREYYNPAARQPAAANGGDDA